jgi:hypothetical protein
MITDLIITEPITRITLSGSITSGDYKITLITPVNLLARTFCVVALLYPPGDTKSSLCRLPMDAVLM